LTASSPRPSTADTKHPAGFDVVIEKGLAKRLSDRYETVLEFADAARAALPTGPKAKSPSLAMKRPRSPGTPKPSASISTSAQTLLAPTKPAKVAGRVDAQDHHSPLVSNEDKGSDGGFFWFALWITLLVATAVLVVVAIGVV
jgi:hypothetical protein